MATHSTDREYGGDTINASVQATGSNFTTAEALAFNWTYYQKKVLIQNHPSSGIDLYVLWNDAASPTAAVTKWDAILQPGDYIGSPDGIMVGRVGIWSTGAATLGTNFAIRGWQ